MDKCPEYKFVGTTMSRLLCEKPECPQPGRKRKAIVAHTGKENEQEGGSEPQLRKCANMGCILCIRTKYRLHTFGRIEKIKANFQYCTVRALRPCCSMCTS